VLGRSSLGCLVKSSVVGFAESLAVDSAVGSAIYLARLSGRFFAPNLPNGSCNWSLAWPGDVSFLFDVVFFSPSCPSHALLLSPSFFLLLSTAPFRAVVFPSSFQQQARRLWTFVAIMKIVSQTRL
jgi:hypothetical protein